LFLLKVPAEFNDNAIEIMRECMINAKLIKKENIRNLKFTTERKFETPNHEPSSTLIWESELLYIICI
jgi:hypothetical protein